MGDRDAVHEALQRWEREGLIDGAHADRLRSEVAAHAAGAGRRWAQYAIAATGAVILVLAASVFLRWAWPLMGSGSRSLVLTAAGLATLGLGLLTETRARLAPAAYLLQAAGLTLVLMAFLYSRRAWVDSSPAALVLGFFLLAVPLVATAIASGRDPISPSIHMAFGYAFLAAFLYRSTGLDANAILWILDGVAAVSIVLLIVRLRRAEHHGEDDWTLNAFVTSLYAAGVLLFGTALGPFDLEVHAVWALDLWLAAVTGLTLWGIHGAPPGLRRAWFGRQLGFCVVLAIPLAFATAAEALDLPAAPVALIVAALGFVSLRYGLRQDSRDTLAAGCLALLAAAWYFGVEMGGALGTVLALAASAALFFWLAMRIGLRTRHAD